MKNNHIIIESNLAYVLLFYQKKYYPFIKLLFFFKIMVIEMLLNNDIAFFFVQIILNFQMEINVIMYIIELKKKVNSNHFI